LTFPQRSETGAARPLSTSRTSSQSIWASPGVCASGLNDVLFTVLRPARYIDESERVEFGELHVFTGKGFVVKAIRQSRAASTTAPARSSSSSGHRGRCWTCWPAWSPDSTSRTRNRLETAPSSRSGRMTRYVGYPLAVALMMATSLTLFLVFRRRGWL
jgi:hypothetical protein